MKSFMQLMSEVFEKDIVLESGMEFRTHSEITNYLYHTRKANEHHRMGLKFSLDADRLEKNRKKSSAEYKTTTAKRDAHMEAASKHLAAAEGFSNRRVQERNHFEALSKDKSHPYFAYHKRTYDNIVLNHSRAIKAADQASESLKG